MREELRKLEGQRLSVRAKFSRFGQKPQYKGPPLKTVLFVGITTVCGRALCDHVWLTVGKQLAALDLRDGDEILFSAVVKRYTKGYRGRRDDFDASPICEDFKLAWPKFFRRVTDDPARAIAAAVGLPVSSIETFPMPIAPGQLELAL